MTAPAARLPLDARPNVAPACTQDAPWNRVPGLWVLPEGRAQTLPAATVLRWLVVDTGRVWLTECRPDAAPTDVVLSAGERWLLPADTAWVVEGWPAAGARLVEAPPAVRSRRASDLSGAGADLPSRVWPAWRRLRSALSAWGRSRGVGPAGGPPCGAAS